jgi:hypothetical protein
LEGDGSVAAWYRNAFGKGRAYYCGVDIMSAYAHAASSPGDPNAPRQMQAIQNLFAGVLGQSGVAPAVTVRLRDPASGAAGEFCPWVWTRAKASGQNRFFIVQRNYIAPSAALPDVPVRVEFKKPGVIYDVAAGKLLGRGNAVDLTMVNSTSRVFAVLPTEVTGIAAQPAGTARRGRDMAFAIEVATADHNADPRVVRVDVRRPDGTAHESYSTDLILKNARGVVTIPFALNDPVGAWRVHITDVASGVGREWKVTLQ